MGFSLNFTPSPAGAGATAGAGVEGVATLSTGAGAGTAAGSGVIGTTGSSIATGGGVSGAAIGADTGPAPASAPATGATTRGLSRTRGAAAGAALSPSTIGAIKGAAGAGIISATATAGAGSGETGAGGGGGATSMGAVATTAAGSVVAKLGVRRGFKRTFGGSASAGGGATGGGGGAAAAGAAGGVSDSASFSRGFRRNAGGGVDGSSLMRDSKVKFRRGAKTKSFPRRPCSPPPRSRPHSLMIPRLSLTCLCLAALLTTGCLFSKKSAEPKENPAIAGSVEEIFKVRWIDKRAAELTAQGKTADAARTLATGEFRERYLFNATPQKK